MKINFNVILRLSRDCTVNTFSFIKTKTHIAHVISWVIKCENDRTTQRVSQKKFIVLH